MNSNNRQKLLKEILERKLSSRSQDAGIPPIENRQGLPLSSTQERMWFLYQWDPENPLYNRPTALRIRGEINTSKLTHSLNNIIQRHESIRTIFPTINGKPVQQIQPFERIELTYEDLSHFSKNDRDDAARQRVVEISRKPFDIAAGPIFRTHLLRLTKNDHIFLFVTYHISFDHWSETIFINELISGYESLLARQRIKAVELPIQYAAFSQWQRSRMKDDIYQRHLDYWIKQLGGELQTLDLPTDRPRPSMQSYVGAKMRFDIPSIIVEQLNTISRQENATLYMTLIAAFSVLLYRYSGQEDILIGTPVSGRNHVQIEKLIGLFINTLVLRTDLSGNPTFRDLLSRVRSVALNAYDHQNLPFDQLIQALQPKRDLSRSPLFQVMFNLENIPQKLIEIVGLNIESYPFDMGISVVDLSLEITPSKAGALGCVIEYNTDLFDPKTIQRLVGHFLVLLNGIIESRDREIAYLPILTDREKHQILIEWNDTQADYPQNNSIHELFEKSVERTPDKIALRFEKYELTYAKLNSQANRLANNLRLVGVRSNDLVGICVERSLDMVIGILGILKAGAAYLPLDPEYPSARLNFMLEDAQSSYVITQSSLLEKIGVQDIQFICLDVDKEEITSQDHKNLGLSNNPEDHAYIIYTSGSTGNPKGVQVSQKAVVNFISAMRVRPGISSDDTLLAVTTLSFDISVLELLLPICIGGKIVVANQVQVKDGELLADLINESGITVMQATPATWKMLITMGWDGNTDLRIFCGGERLSNSLAEELLPRCKELWNMYGPTETTIWSTVCKVEDSSGRIPIGSPIDNTQVYVLNCQLQVEPIGVAGELFIGGDGVSRGYWQRDDLTNKKFIHYFEKLKRLYRTGDLVKWRADGTLDILGRLDHQVKIRGYRIELGEIEAALNELDGIDDAVVIAREEKSGDKRIIAYVVLSGGVDLSVQTIQENLKLKLPSYMVPVAFVFIDDIPVMPNGKVDWNALPSPTIQDIRVDRERDAPRDDVEYQLIRIWEKILSVTGVSVSDDFFELGGHSLLAVQLFSQIEKAFGVKLPLATLFEFPSISHQARLLKEEGWDAYWSPLVAVQPKGTRLPLFCVAAAGGNVLTYRDLAMRLGEDQSVYALQSRGLDGISNPVSQVVEIATLFIQAIQAVQSDGPYHLCGSSFGGLVAYEMACQLMIKGLSVRFLGLFDTYGPNFRQAFQNISPRRKKLFGTIDRIRLHIGNLWMADWKGKVDYVGVKSRRLNRRLKKTGARSKQMVIEPLPKEIQDIQKANRQALNTYKPRVYSGDLQVFRASHQPYGMPDDPTLGWRELVSGKIESYEIKGHHGALAYEPQVKNLAPVVQMCLSKGVSIVEKGQ